MCCLDLHVLFRVLFYLVLSTFGFNWSVLLTSTEQNVERAHLSAERGLDAPSDVGPQPRAD